MKALTDEQLDALFRGIYRDTDGDYVAAMRAAFEAGRLCPRKRRIDPAATKDDRRRGHKAEAAPFMRRRHAAMLNAVSRRHGLDVTGIPPGARMSAREAEAIAEAAWLLRHQVRMGLEDIGAVLNRHYSSVWEAIRRVEAKIAERPELRVELLALAGGEERKAVAA